MPKTSIHKIMEEDNKVVEVATEKKENKVKVPEKKVFDQNDGIMCKSVVQGGLYMEGLKTKIVYEWGDYGDESEVEYRDLVAAVRAKSKFIFNPWLIIEDEDFINEFPQLQSFYREAFSVKDLRDILNQPVDQMIATIKSLPSGAVDSLKTIAAQQVALGALDSVRKIKALDEIFGTDLNLVGELFQDA